MTLKDLSLLLSKRDPRLNVFQILQVLLALKRLLKEADSLDKDIILHSCGFQKIKK